MMGDNTSDFDGTTWFVSIKNMKKGLKDPPFLQVAEPKKDGVKGFDVHEKAYTKTAGRITKIWLSQFEWEGKKIDKLNINLEDTDPEQGKCIFKLSAPLGGASRELINKLATVANHGKLDGIFTIGVYMAENFAIPNSTDVIDEMRGVYLHQDGEKIGKAYAYAQLKDKVKQVTVNNEPVNDYFELNAFFMKVVTDIIQPAVLEEIFNQPPLQTEETAKTPNVYEEPKGQQQAPAPTEEPEWLNNNTEPVDDLPF